MEIDMNNIENVWRNKIKEIAREHNLPVGQLLALSPKNDPFYIGSETEIKNAIWVFGIWKKMTDEQDKYSVYLRGMHYWYSSFEESKRPDGLPYLNTDKDWGFITQAAKHARYFNLIPYDRITDEKNPKPIENASYFPDDTFEEAKNKINVDSIADVISRTFRLIWGQNYQPYMLEVWCEKDIKGEKNAERVLNKYNINLVMGEGELSVTSVNLAIERIKAANKPTRIFYISDFDPKGFQMPVSIARKLEWFSHHGEYDVRLKPIALTLEQCIEHKLPRKPIRAGQGVGSGAKAYDTLKDKFEEKFGTGATELNALEGLYPGKLAELIEKAVIPYWNEEINNKIYKFNEQVTDAVKKSVIDQSNKLQDFIDSLDLNEAKEIAETWEIDPEDIDLADEGEDWLFSSDREYMQQLHAYKYYSKTGNVDGLDEELGE